MKTIPLTLKGNKRLNQCLQRSTQRALAGVANGALNIDYEGTKQTVSDYLTTLSGQYQSYRGSRSLESINGITSVARDGLESYLASEQLSHRLNSTQVLKIQTYANELEDIYQRHQSKVKDRRRSLYVDQQQSALEQTVVSFGTSTELTAVNYEIGQLANILRGEGKRANGKRAYTYTQRADLAKKRVDSLMSAIGSAYTERRIDQKQAKTLIDSVNGMVQGWGKSKYVQAKNTRGSELSNHLTVFDELIHQERKYFRAPPEIYGLYTSDNRFRDVMHLAVLHGVNGIASLEANKEPEVLLYTLPTKEKVTTSRTIVPLFNRIPRVAYKAAAAGIATALLVGTLFSGLGFKKRTYNETESRQPDSAIPVR